MYRIKQLPRDFIVRELPNLKISSSGKYSILLLKKANLTTNEALELIAEKLKISQNDIGFAGNKDRRALTEQLISLKGDCKARLSGTNSGKLSLKFLGYSNSPIRLGCLEGNEFEITIRNIRKKEIAAVIKRAKQNNPFSNLFGEQRFSKQNDLIGKFIVMKQFARACALIAKNDIMYGPYIAEHLKLSPNDFIGALRLIPKKILMLYTRSFQSRIFNETASKVSKFTKRNAAIPIVGFGTELKNSRIDKIIAGILKTEGVSQRDFIIPQLPELSSEGNVRNLYVRPKNLKLSAPEDDELNPGSKKLTLYFALPKGSYATVLIRHLFS